MTGAWGIAGRSAGYFTRPRGAAFAADGAIAVADSFNYRIARFDPDGTFAGQLGLVSSFTGYPSEGSDPGQFSLPASVTFDATGNTVVADTGNDRVVVLAPDGSVLRTTPAGQLADPQAVAPQAPEGSVLVADTANNRVVTLASDGSLAGQRTGLSHPTSVAWDRGSKIFATDDTRVRDIIAGENVAPPSGATAWDHPDGIAVNESDGTLYVSELRPGTADGARVVRGTPGSGAGYDWDTIATEGSADGQVIAPGGLALSDDGATLLVADYGNNRVLRLDAPGHAPGCAGHAVGRARRRPARHRRQQSPGHRLRHRLRAALRRRTPGDADRDAGRGRGLRGLGGRVHGRRADLLGDDERRPGRGRVVRCGPRRAAAGEHEHEAGGARARHGHQAADRAVDPASRAQGRPAQAPARSPGDAGQGRDDALAASHPVTVTIEVPRAGVRRGSRCIAPPRKHSKRDRSCTRPCCRRAGSRKVKLGSGRRSPALTPLFTSPTLPTGRYRISLTALDTSANRVGPLTARFRVMR